MSVGAAAAERSAGQSIGQGDFDAIGPFAQADSSPPGGRSAAGRVQRPKNSGETSGIDQIDAVVVERMAQSERCAAARAS